jgi:hypothetical protein
MLHSIDRRMPGNFASSVVTLVMHMFEFMSRVLCSCLWLTGIWDQWICVKLPTFFCVWQRLNLILVSSPLQVKMVIKIWTYPPVILLLKKCIALVGRLLCASLPTIYWLGTTFFLYHILFVWFSPWCLCFMIIYIYAMQYPWLARC